MSERSDEELMVGYQNGSIEDFDFLYQRYSRRIYGYLKKRVRSDAGIEDLFQTVFLKIHHARQHFNSSQPFANWVFTITRNVMIDYFRKNASDKLVFDEDLIETATANVTHDSALLEIIESELEKIPPRQRQAVEMRYRDDLNDTDIANRLKTSPINVRQMVSRAVKKMRGGL